MLFETHVTAISFSFFFMFIKLNISHLILIRIKIFSVFQSSQSCKATHNWAQPSFEGGTEEMHAFSVTNRSQISYILNGMLKNFVNVLYVRI